MNMIIFIIVAMNEELQCCRCNHKWTPRIEERPKNCPACKSPRWDKPPVSYLKASRAHAAVGKAVADGKLKKQPCVVCGSKKTIAHHEDYDKPLEVVWYCDSHHRQRHSEIGDALMAGDAVKIHKVPVDLWRIVKSEAALAGQTTSQYIVDVLRRAIEKSDNALREAVEKK